MTATGRTVRDADGVRVVVERPLDAPVEDVWRVLTSRTGQAIGSWSGDPASGVVRLSFVEGGEPEDVRIARCGTSIGPGWEFYLDRLAADVAGDPLPADVAPYLEHAAAYALP